MSNMMSGVGNWWTRWFGLDPIDLTIHVMATGFVMALLDGWTRNEPLTIAAGFVGVVVYGWRRRRILDALPPPTARPARPARTAGATPLPDVVHDLLEQQGEVVDHLERRVLELEERLDFAERLLARPPSEAAEAGREITPMGGTP